MHGIRSSILTSMLLTLAFFVPGLAHAQTYNQTTLTGQSIDPGITDIGNHCDDCVTVIALPFPFQFYDQVFTSARLSSNGNLQFMSSASDFTNICFPAGQLNYAISPFWDDQYLVNPGQGIFTSTVGSAPNRI